MGIYLVMINNIKRSLNHKVLLVITFLLPVILCMIAGSVPFGKVSLRIGIVTLNRTEVTKEMEALYQILDQTEGIKYEEAKEKTIHTDLIIGKYHAILDLRNNSEKEPFELISYQNDEKKLALQEVLMNGILQGGVSLNGLKKDGFSLTERSMALFLTLFLIFSSIHASTIIRDKHNGTFARYRFAKRNHTGYILGYFLHAFLITYVQILLCMISLFILQKGFTLTLMETLVTSLVITLIATIIAVFICYNCQSEVQANITTSSFAAIMSLLGGTFIAVEAMPGLLRILSVISPIRWVVELLRII